MKLTTLKIKQGISQYKQTLKEITITFLVMSIFWILLGVLNYIGIKSKILYPLIFFTGSLNGMQEGGIIGIVGGMISKFLLVLMIVQTIIPIYKKHFGKNKKQIKMKEKYNSLIMLSRKIFSRGLKLAGFTILGLGIALIIYAFLTVNGKFQNSFVIILALISTLRILLSQTSTIIRFFTAIFRLEHISNLPVYSFFLGLSIGFTLSISISIIIKSIILVYVIGFVLSMIGYILVLNNIHSRA